MTVQPGTPLRKRRRRSALPAHSKTPTDHLDCGGKHSATPLFERVLLDPDYRTSTVPNLYRRYPSPSFSGNASLGVPSRSPTEMKTS